MHRLKGPKDTKVKLGILRYGEKYRLTDGIDLLKRAGIEVVYIGLEDDEKMSE